MNVDYLPAVQQHLDHLPMWEAGWAGDIAWFQFGKQVRRPDRKGGQRVVGEYALHISCAWSWRSSSGFVRADENSDRDALRRLGDLAPKVVGAPQGANGALQLSFDNGDRLAIDEVIEAGATEEDESEFWRLFQPGLPTPHLVAANTGVEWHEA